MNSVRMSPDQDPDEFLYELDTRRKRLNACDPPERPTGRQFEDIILQALPPNYERIRTSNLKKSGFGIADICRMMSAIYAAKARLSSTTGIARRGAAMHEQTTTAEAHLPLLLTRGSFQEHVSPPRQA